MTTSAVAPAGQPITTECPPPSPDMGHEEFRAAARAYLSSLAPLKGAASAVSVLGAGTDDFAKADAYMARVGRDGWIAPTWPVGLGGVGLRPELAAIWAAETLEFDIPDLYYFRLGLNIVGPAIRDHGTEEQQRRWLPRIASGEEIWCQLFSEPGSGSDLAGLSTLARRDGDIWELTGQKVWSSRAHLSHWGLLLARCDLSVPKHEGIVAFALPMDAEGVEVRPLRQMNGDRHFNEVFLDRVRLGDDVRIGAAGDGWRVARTALGYERRAAGSGSSVTPAQLIELARRRGMIDDPVMRDRLVKTIVELEIARLSTLRSRAGGASVGPIGSASKLRSVRAVKSAAELAASLLGVEITVMPGEWQTLLLTAPSMSIRGGTDEIQRDILAERVLGLPKGPDPYRGRPWSEVPKS